MATATIDAQVKKYLDAQAKHSEANQGRTSKEGGKDYQSDPVEVAAGEIRLPYYERLIAEAANDADQDSIDDLTAQYSEARLRKAIEKAAKEDS